MPIFNPTLPQIPILSPFHLQTTNSSPILSTLTIIIIIFRCWTQRFCESHAKQTRNRLSSTMTRALTSLWRRSSSNYGGTHLLMACRMTTLRSILTNRFVVVKGTFLLFVSMLSSLLLILLVLFLLFILLGFRMASED